MNQPVQIAPTLPIDAFERRMVGVAAKPVSILNDGQKIVDLEQFQLRPNAASGTTTLQDEASYVAFTKLHAGSTPDDKARSSIFYVADETSCELTTVFNATSPTDPHWQDFRGVYKPLISPEWKRWKGGDGQWMSQAQFAEFIEANSVDIRVPTSADMLTIAVQFEAKKKVNFASSVRLDNGARELVYEEEIKGTAGKGKIEVPETFSLGIPVFVGGSAWQVDAHFRYQITDGGRLQIRYQLIRPHKVIEEEVKELLKRVIAECNLPVYRGTTPELR